MCIFFILLSLDGVYGSGHLIKPKPTYLPFMNKLESFARDTYTGEVNGGELIPKYLTTSFEERNQKFQKWWSAQNTTLLKLLQDHQKLIKVDTSFQSSPTTSVARLIPTASLRN